MKNNQKLKVTFKYYEMPLSLPVFALFDTKEEQVLHMHNYLEINYCSDGDGFVCVGNSKTPFSEGTFVVFPPKFPHAIVSHSNSSKVSEHLFVDAKSIIYEGYEKKGQVAAEKLLSRVQMGARICESAKYPFIAIMVKRIFILLKENPELWGDEVKALLFTTLLEIARLQEITNENVTEEQENIVMMDLVLDHISKHYAEFIQVSDLAEICHISEVHFRRIFYSCVNKTPAEYMNQVRIRAACELLKNGKEQIAVIAHKTGFNVLATFERNFKKLVGMSPREWRKSKESDHQN